MANYNIALEKARQWGLDVLEKADYTGEAAESTIDVLLHADLRGVDSHGLIRLVAYVDRILGTESRPVAIVRESETSCLIDAGFQPGPVGAALGMKQAIVKAKVHGMGMASVRHSNHFGAAAYYALLAVREGMLGISMSNASPRIAPWGSVEALVGNNPLAIALPGPEFPIVLDMANTVVANGKVRSRLREGRPLEPGWALDKDANPTLDPAEAVKGLLMPIGGYKGVGIAVMVDLLCAALSNGAFSKEVGRIEDASRPTDASHFFLAADISALVTPEELAANIAQYTQDFKAVRLKEDVAEVFLPGEIEWRTECHHREVGIPLSDAALAELNEMAGRIGAPALSP